MALGCKVEDKARSIINLLWISCNVFQLATSKRAEQNTPYLYELDGTEALGSYLWIQPCSDRALELSECSIQWYRLTSEGGKKELISGKGQLLLLLFLIFFPFLCFLFLNKAWFYVSKCSFMLLLMSCFWNVLLMSSALFNFWGWLIVRIQQPTTPQK